MCDLGRYWSRAPTQVRKKTKSLILKQCVKNCSIDTFGICLARSAAQHWHQYLKASRWVFFFFNVLWNMNFLHLFMVFFYISFIDASWPFNAVKYNTAALCMCICSNAPPDETRRANNKAHHNWSTVSLVDKVYMVTAKQLLSPYFHSKLSARRITWQWENNATAKQQKITTTWIGSCSALNSFFRGFHHTL